MFESVKNSARAAAKYIDMPGFKNNPMKALRWGGAVLGLTMIGSIPDIIAQGNKDGDAERALTAKISSKPEYKNPEDVGVDLEAALSLRGDDSRLRAIAEIQKKLTAKKMLSEAPASAIRL